MLSIFLEATLLSLLFKGSLALPSGSTHANSVSSSTGASSGTTASSIVVSGSSAPGASQSSKAISLPACSEYSDGQPQCATSAVPGSSSASGITSSTVISFDGGVTTIPTGVTTPITITGTDGAVTTYTPSSPSGTSLTKLSSPIGSGSSSRVASSTGSSSLPKSTTITSSNGATTTISSSASSNVASSSPASSSNTGSSGSSNAASGLPASSSNPVNSGFTTVGASSQTIVSNSDGVLTIPTGISTPIVLTEPDGKETTYTPPVLASSSTSGAGGFTSASSGAEGFTSVGPSSQTIVSNSDGVLTIPTGVSTPIVLTEPDGQLTTYTPPVLASESHQQSGGFTTVGPSSQTIISNSDGLLTLPTGVSTPIVLTEPDGHTTTYTPPALTLSHSGSSSSSAVAGFVLPITTSVLAPKATEGGSVIPCNLWFFSICIHWKDSLIGGWEIDLPPGVYPPGPPPPFKVDPTLSISVSGTLPKWPRYTIGPKHIPTFPPNPDDQCNTESAALCVTTTSFGVSTSGTFTTTTATQVESTCGTVYGCDVIASSTSALATATCTSTSVDDPCPGGSLYPYVIYPEDGTDTDRVNSIFAELKQYVNDTSQIQTSTTDTLGLNYWQLPLNESSATKLRTFSGVGTLNAQCDPACQDNSKCIVCYDPSLTIKVQQDASDALAFVSWPSGQPAPSPNKYYFDDSNGEGVTVYILDTGANLDSPEFQNSQLVSADNIEWIHIGTDVDGRQPNDDSFTPQDPTEDSRIPAHGTAMLGAVAGNTLGVAKKIKPILVRMPRRYSFGKGFTKEDWLDGITAIQSRLTTSGPGVSSIVLIAQGWPDEAFALRRPDGSFILDDNNHQIISDLEFNVRTKALLAAIAESNALVITGSGNIPGPDASPVDNRPAVFAKTTEVNPLKALLVVGAMTIDAQLAPRFPIELAAGVPQIFAPGYKVKVANGQPVALANGQPYRDGYGTSEASAHTAGLAAYFLALDRLNRLPNSGGLTHPVGTPEGLKNYIISQGWVRNPLNGINPISIWNFVTLDQQNQACRWDPPTLRKRDDDTCPAEPGSSSSTVGASSTATTLSTAASSTFVSTTSEPSSSIQSSSSTVQSSSSSLQSSSSTVQSSSLSVQSSAVPTTPLTKHPIQCENEANFPGHGNIAGSAQGDFAARFCGGAADISSVLHVPSLTSEKPTGFNLTTQDSHGINYSYMIQWINGCVSDSPTIDIQQPIPGLSNQCSVLFINDYDNCNNGGVGGSVQIGCAKYTFIGGLGAPPPCPLCQPVSI